MPRKTKKTAVVSSVQNGGEDFQGVDFADLVVMHLEVGDQLFQQGSPQVSCRGYRFLRT